MPLRLFLFVDLLILSLWLGKGSILDSSERDIVIIPKSHPSVANKISVRESTVDLQVSVGQTIFVFGKAKGTLDKVKVGSHVMNFSQVQGVQGNESSFSKVAWKKLKDGSIQIQSSYSPWPSTLAWTVTESGLLKMEASPPPANTEQMGWLGLGFNFQDHQLIKVSWKEELISGSQVVKQWKNENLLPILDSTQVLEDKPKAFFNQFLSSKFEFETVTLEVKSETPDVYFGLRQIENQGSSIPEIISDLGFFFNKPKNQTGFIPQTSIAPSPTEKSISSNPLVLWFHFQ